LNATIRGWLDGAAAAGEDVDGTPAGRGRNVIGSVSLTGSASSFTRPS
jgi:hypothetical protein